MAVSCVLQTNEAVKRVELDCWIAGLALRCVTDGWLYTEYKKQNVALWVDGDLETWRRSMRKHRKYSFESRLQIAFTSFQWLNGGRALRRAMDDAWDAWKCLGLPGISRASTSTTASAPPVLFSSTSSTTSSPAHQLAAGERRSRRSHSSIVLPLWSGKEVLPGTSRTS